MKKQEQIALINEQETIVLDRESKLSATDYIAAKLAEGRATREEYTQQLADRQQWRDDINAANARIAELKAAEIEPEEQPHDIAPEE